MSDVAFEMHSLSLWGTVGRLHMWRPTLKTYPEMMCREGFSPGVMDCAGHSRSLFRSLGLVNNIIKIPNCHIKAAVQLTPCKSSSRSQGWEGPHETGNAWFTTARPSVPPSCTRKAIPPFDVILFGGTLRNWLPLAARPAEQSATEGQKQRRERLDYATTKGTPSSEM